MLVKNFYNAANMIYKIESCLCPSKCSKIYIKYGQQNDPKFNVMSVILLMIVKLAISTVVQSRSLNK